MPVRTYLDSSVLIAIVEGEQDVAHAALDCVEDPGRELVLSEAVRLEVLPRRLGDGDKREQLDQPNELFQRAATVLANFPRRVWQRAIEEAASCRMQPMDALHVAAALEMKAEELLTTQKPRKSLCKTHSIRAFPLRARQLPRIH